MLSELAVPEVEGLSDFELDVVPELAVPEDLALEVPEDLSFEVVPELEVPEDFELDLVPELAVPEDEEIVVPVDLSLDALTEVNNPDPFDVYLAKFCAITTIASETWFLINKRKSSNKSVCQFRQFLTSDFQRVFRSIHKIPKQT